MLQDIITELIKVNPNYRPPPDYRPAKRVRKVYLPQSKNGINYIGLILGRSCICLWLCTKSMLELNQMY